MTAALEAVLTADMVEAAADWRNFARPSQLEPPGDWLFWVCLAGRGWGKTRTGAEWVRSRVERGLAKHIVIAAPTSADVRDIAVEGESGVLAVFPPYRRPVYEPSKRRITFHTGAKAILISADEPERFRGLQADTVWADELAAWRYPEAWDQLMLGLRLGTPRGIVTTTPKPSKIIRELVESDQVHLTRGSTFENKSNLAQAFLERIVQKYEGTRIGRQELHAEILEDVEGAIVTLDHLEQSRVRTVPPLRRVVVGVDPAVTSGTDADETGIVAAGVGEDGEGYVLADHSLRAAPLGWARAVLALAESVGAEKIVAERNNGGEMVEQTIRQLAPNAPVKTVVATRGKHVRFEPVGLLYEQGRIHHVGALPKLEEQLCGFTSEGYQGTDSPDRADAAVWALSELMVKPTWGFEDLYAAA